MKNLSFGILGGDDRNYILSKILINEGYKVNTYLLGDIDNVKDIVELFDNSEYIISALPFSRDSININSPKSEKIVSVKEVYETFMLKKYIDKKIFAGKIDNIPLRIQGRVFDYLKREEFTILNNIPSAEGAIYSAMQNLTSTIYSSKTLVIGYGRLGKILCEMLKGIGSNVSACARKKGDVVLSETFGNKGIYLKDLSRHLNKFDVIFNTVPSKILDEKLIDNISKDCLIIDLASSPGGLDHEYARKNGLKVLWELGIPGKYAPVTSAKYIKETIFNIIEEIEENNTKTI